MRFKQPDSFGIIDYLYCCASAHACVLVLQNHIMVAKRFKGLSVAPWLKHCSILDPFFEVWGDLIGICLLIGRDKRLCEDWLNIKVWLTRDRLASQLTSALAEHASRRTGITLTSTSVNDRTSQPSLSQSDVVLYHTLRPNRPWTNPVRFRSPVGLSDAPSASEAQLSPMPLFKKPDVRPDMEWEQHRARVSEWKNTLQPFLGQWQSDV